jgi:Zn-dependent protease
MLAGIRVEIHPTWFIIFVLITTSMVAEFAAQFPNRPYFIHWTVGLISSVLFFSSVLFHEMSHSLLAQKRGYPVRSITLFVFGGVSEIEEEAHTPGAEFWIAIIGPFSSFFLALFFFLVHQFTANLFDEFSAMFRRLGVINLALGIFNMLPAFPLDGGRVLRSLLWRSSGDLRKATRTAGKAGQLFGYGLIMLGIVTAFRTGNLLSGLWIGFIGWFLTNAAEGTVQQVEIHRLLLGVRARDVMATDCLAVSGDLSIDELVERYIMFRGNRCFMITRDGILEGLVSLHEIKQIPKTDWAATPIRQIMKRTDELRTATPETSLENILRTLDEDKINQIPILEHGRLAGIVTRERLLNMIRARMILNE